MNVLYIILAIILLVVLLLLCPLTLKVRYSGGQLTIKVCGIKLTPRKPKKKKAKKAEKKRKPKKEKKKSAESKKTEKPKNKKKKTSVEDVKNLLLSLGAPAKKIFSSIKLRGVTFVYVVGGAGDAAAAAIKYGYICAGVSAITPLVRGVFDAEIKKLDVRLDFLLEKSYNEFSFAVKLRVYALLAAAWIFVKNFIKIKEK